MKKLALATVLVCSPTYAFFENSGSSYHYCTSDAVKEIAQDVLDLLRDQGVFPSIKKDKLTYCSEQNIVFDFTPSFNETAQKYASALQEHKKLQRTYEKICIVTNSIDESILQMKFTGEKNYYIRFDKQAKIPRRSFGI